MLECPFELEKCLWPRPTVWIDGVSQPEWNAPTMPVKPEVSLELLEGGWYWTINWKEFFRANIASVADVRGFHTVFHLRMKYTGVLFSKDLFLSYIVRRGEEVLYENGDPRSPHLAKIRVNAGDLLEFALFQEELQDRGLRREWTWGAFLLADNLKNFSSAPDPSETLFPYLQQVQRELRDPNGPPLKIFTSCRSPIRTVVAVYSLILNGYVPSEIYLFGDHQWNDQQQAFLKAHLPFAHNVPTTDVLAHLQSLDATELIQMSEKSWVALKTAIALLYAPHEFCMIDDDIIVLEPLDDALEAFKTHDLVYTTNASHEKDYIKTWKHIFPSPPVPLPTGSLNAGFYWLRNTKDPRDLVAQLQRTPMSMPPWSWEQGFIALTYLDKSLALSTQRYFVPMIDGLPGGSIQGYDYRQNPCAFACLHFAGPIKPSDGTLLKLLPQILHI
jgi:hypothetical protein